MDYVNRTWGADAPDFDARDYHRSRRADGDPERVHWTTPGLRVTRLRLLSDPGHPYWDLSYCHGVLDGRPVDVQVPFVRLPKRGLRGAIIDAAKSDGVYAKGLGILDAISTLQ